MLHLFAAVPAYNGSMLVKTTQSLVAIHDMIRDRGGRFEFHHRHGSPVSLVRNAISAAFLMSDADLLLMLDADQAVDSETIARMIDLGEPVVKAFYPKRFFDWDAVRLPASNMGQVLNQASRYVGKLVFDANGQAEVVNGFARAEYFGTGVTLLRREAFEHLKRQDPQLEKNCLHVEAWSDLAAAGAWSFFNPINNAIGAPLAEDISFSLRWRHAGGEIWADVASPIGHIGHWTFEGAYLNHLQAL